MRDCSALGSKLSGQMIFNVYSDPEDSWIEVRMRDLIALGITEEISAYSYMSGQWVYLEEDQDFKIWIKAYAAVQWPPKYRRHYTEGRSSIRSHESYISPLSGAK